MRMTIEVASEFLCILACVMLSQFTLIMNEESTKVAENGFIAIIALLVLVNTAYLIVMIINKRKLKKHNKLLVKLKEHNKKT